MKKKSRHKVIVTRKKKKPKEGEYEGTRRRKTREKILQRVSLFSMLITLELR